MLKFKCKKDGEIQFLGHGKIILKNWSFGIVNAPAIGTELSPYIFIGEHDPEAVLTLITSG